MTSVDQQARAAAPPSPRSVSVAVRGPLQPIEMATAAVLGAMTVVLVIAGWLLPHTSAITAFGAVPMGVVAHRHRPRAVVAATVASVAVGFVVAGTGVISTIVLCAAIGGLAGHAHRRHWGGARVVAGAAVLGPLIATVTIGVLAVFSSLRKLTLEQLRNTWRGMAGVLGRLLGAVPGHHDLGLRVSRDLDGAIGWAVGDWWETVAVLLVAFTLFATLVAWRLLGDLFVRLDRIRATDRLASAPVAPSDRSPSDRSPSGRSFEPVPVGLHDVRVRYPGASTDALAGVDLSIGAAELVAVVGPNGSGKSTLSRLLAGCAPTGGDVVRPGAVGLGEPGGTAIVTQRPESQVLGVRVADDLGWGLPRDFEVDTAAVLADVGLTGMDKRETSGLSGGELQRLAVAAALVRRPRLLISDESTAMIDAAGRRRLVALLAGLPRTRDMTVVHVTHREDETMAADRTIRLTAGRLVGAATSLATGGDVRASRSCLGAVDAATDAAANAATDAPGTLGVTASPGPLADDVEAWPARTAGRGVPRVGTPLLRLVDIGHVYADRTPWSRVALADINLEIRRGEGVLVVGGNGSGKSTLAWIVTGLLRPSYGDCELEGRPIGDQIGSVGLTFQHARLQLQRSTVGRDVQAAGDVGRETAESALCRVGLDPEQLWDRSVDELSGGQLRRVALAGLLARAPRVLVLDEPLAGLDDASRAALLAVLADLRATQRLTLIVISHDLEGAGEICDRLVRLDQGRIVADEALEGVPVG